MVDEVQPAASDVTPGHRTTEFYIHLAVVILSALATAAGVAESYHKGTITSAAALMALGGVFTATVNALGYTTSRTIVKASVLLLAFTLVFSAGCSAEQLAREEAAAHAALVKLEKGVDWLNARPEVVSALLDDAAKASSDPGFQKAVDKARAAVASGDLDRARRVVSLGAAITASAAPVGSSQ